MPADTTPTLDPLARLAQLDDAVRRADAQLAQVPQEGAELQRMAAHLHQRITQAERDAARAGQAGADVDDLRGQLAALQSRSAAIGDVQAARAVALHEAKKAAARYRLDEYPAISAALEGMAARVLDDQAELDAERLDLTGRDVQAREAVLSQARSYVQREWRSLLAVVPTFGDWRLPGQAKANWDADRLVPVQRPDDPRSWEWRANVDPDAPHSSWPQWLVDTLRRRPRPSKVLGGPSAWQQADTRQRALAESALRERWIRQGTQAHEEMREIARALARGSSPAS